MNSDSPTDKHDEAARELVRRAHDLLRLLDASNIRGETYEAVMELTKAIVNMECYLGRSVEASGMLFKQLEREKLRTRNVRATLRNRETVLSYLRFALRASPKIQERNDKGEGHKGTKE